MSRRRRKFDPEEIDPQERLEEEEENDSILRDGQSVRVSLFMKDGAINPDLLPHQKAKAEQQTDDARARRFGLSDGLALHRPGFRYNTDAAAQERTRRAYADAEAADANAWRGAASVTSIEEPRRSPDAMGLDPKQQAYLDYDNWSRDAWRSK